MGIYDCEHRYIANDQRPRCGHEDGDLKECYSTTYSTMSDPVPDECPLLEEDVI